MKVDWTEPVEFAYVLGSDDVKKLVSALEQVGSVTIEVGCVDHITRTFVNVEEFLQFENDPKRQIESLAIASKTPWPGSGDNEALRNYNDRAVSIQLRFNKRKASCFGTQVAANGPEVEVLNLRDAITPIVDGARSRYTVLTGASLRFGLGVISVLLTLAASTTSQRKAAIISTSLW